MIKKTKKYYEDSLKIKYGNPIGASSIEIEDIEKAIDRKIPESLKDYLLWGGKQYNGPIIGTDCFISHILGNTEYLPEFLAENELTNPRPENYLVFYSHQGYVLAWIYLDDSENPEVYYYAEGSTEQIEKVISIDEWFFQDISGLHTC